MPSQLGTPFSKLVLSQNVAIISEFKLESGQILQQCPVAYKTWGKLNEDRDNVMVICHALTGSADVEDWWGPLFGPGRAFDTSKFFVFCANSLGSPYGSASPVTSDPSTNSLYGPDFPVCTIRDDVRLHRLVLDFLGIRNVAIVIGGSMGGMLCLEWAFEGRDFIKNIVPIATSSRHSAWGISWGEAQRQAIYSDPKYLDGLYPLDDPPISGLAAARMQALLTYRSRNSFETRFGRNTPTYTPPITPTTSKPTANVSFSAQSYLRYQGRKFVSRFDANCYISMTLKMDTHDVARGRFSSISTALSSLRQEALVIGIESDGLFTFLEQEELASHIPDSRLVKITSPEGHDGFLLEFEQINLAIVKFLKEVLPNYMDGSADSEGTFIVSKTSIFGEAEVENITEW
ncbi:Homoserine O-acetyltransferase [Neolecta irregularis DAH-3]|uniref:Homoserine O-acetyltransferase n=1 Tax=Neolecta irregularis (strain DAH-3) TaxID=1198029 RepID=A0A1U7LIE4_NEOID|nr:Homoserine O-acetyltransferase [Neolecta irregularis DAH-3]|eukprot:OLL22430.1 Homoserine O-acetyltransferase [Neolecta irregularis DAH-3]